MNLAVVESELNNAFEQLADIGPAVSVFGSARIANTDPLAKQAQQLGRRLSDNGLNVLTGAGPGIMQAVNQGAFAGKSLSIGLNIELPKEQKANPYLDKCIMFEHFFTRKVVLIKQADVCIFFPGGFGTADELLEVLTLVQTRKGRQVKLCLFGRDFWTPLIEWFGTLSSLGYINQTDLDLFHIVDTVDQLMDYIKE
ncbi:MAG: TIGR00730 family Rossman fold protein [Candidatus Thioglobus sp.]|uniref:LOG family protein n=1 Tax=Candidatus Thioglobus sp. TaxID=2026721 RepID=UPI00261F7A7F|nr:TIGR00730 family Rossman fold protein [Candidatus Thioglobus sp.]MDC9727415.1 TIGR00730 family Rossman fold protein [Candidatus Thioglobus sp.]